MENPSEQQTAVIEWVKNGKGSLRLDAFAGCGKTSTLLMITPFLKGEAIMLAFNKAIADEIQGKLSARGVKHVTAKTMHSLGLSSWRRIAPKAEIKQWKVSDIVKSLSKNPDDFYLRNSATICKVVSLAKQAAFGFLTPIEHTEAWEDLIDHFDADELADNDTVEELIAVAKKVLEKSISTDRDVIDYDDMILAPLVHNSPCYAKDWILIDEAQDTNASRRALALKHLKPGTGRVIFVGDVRQAIFGFCGASHDAMDLIKEQLGADVLGLTTTYRCPKIVVQEANRFVPGLVAHQSAPDGIFRSLDTVDKETGKYWFQIAPPDKTSAILCRNTKPLIEQAYLFLANGIGCRIEGREIGEGLVHLVLRWKQVTSTHQLTYKLEDFESKEVSKLMAKGKEDRVQNLRDKVGALRAVISRVNSLGLYGIQDVVTSIRSLFDDKKSGVVTLSTIHKFKGREADVVYLLDRANTLPSPYARQDWQKLQEENLEYVAITRAKKELIDLVRPPKEER